MPPAVAILGRPNVGKSTLFNRIAGRKAAIVHDLPGATRDRQETAVQWGELHFRLVDTAGFDMGAQGSLSQRMTEQTIEAIRQADVCLFIIDARGGVTTGDDIIAQALRRSGKPVVFDRVGGIARAPPVIYPRRDHAQDWNAVRCHGPREAYSRSTCRTASQHASREASPAP